MRSQYYIMNLHSGAQSAIMNSIHALVKHFMLRSRQSQLMVLPIHRIQKGKHFRSYRVVEKYSAKEVGFHIYFSVFTSDITMI